VPEPDEQGPLGGPPRMNAWILALVAVAGVLAALSILLGTNLR
jgi:hypothetical protein